ncbi:MAG TPA: hypothetical protein VLY04_12240 [Bryobacteraceae bacterium]|nr:hypothetical protein [Bryobacteraceae bacterium]
MAKALLLIACGIAGVSVISRWIESAIVSALTQAETYGGGGYLAAGIALLVFLALTRSVRLAVQRQQLQQTPVSPRRNRICLY